MKKCNFKKLMLGTTVALAASCFAIPALAADGDVIITYWNSFTGSDGDIVRQIVEEFNALDNGYTIEMDIMANATLSEKLATALTTGNAPSMVFQNNAQVGMHGKNETMMYVDDFFEKTGMSQDQFIAGSLENLQYEGKQMMLPTHWYSSYLYWNKDLFEAAGLDPDTPPATWDEAIEMAEAITDADKHIYGIGLPVGGAIPWFFSNMRSNGGEFFDLETKTSLLDSEANVKTLEWIQDIAARGLTPAGNTGADLDNIMFADQLGIYVNGPWLVNGLRENEINFGVAGMPKGTETTVGIVEEYGNCIPVGTPEEEVLGVYEFMKYWYSEEVSKHWSLANGFPPFLTYIAEDEEVMNDEIVNTFGAMKDYGELEGPGLTTVAQINGDVLFPMVENIMAGNDVQTELTAASAAVDEILATE